MIWHIRDARSTPRQLVATSLEPLASCVIAGRVLQSTSTRQTTPTDCDFTQDLVSQFLEFDSLGGKTPTLSIQIECSPASTCVGTHLPRGPTFPKGSGLHAKKLARPAILGSLSETVLCLRGGLSPLIVQEGFDESTWE